MKTHQGYLQPAALGLLDAQDRLAPIQALGDPRAALGGVLDWAILVPVVERRPRAEPQAPGGRPADEPRRRFQSLGIPSRSGLGDEPTPFQMLDRRRFHPCLGLSEADGVPDQNPLREFREKLTEAERLDERFDAFKVPAGWEQDGQRLAHKEVAARWPQKNAPNYSGDKDPGVADLESKLIVRAEVTTAREHDSPALEALTGPGDPAPGADRASPGASGQALLERPGIAAPLCEKGPLGPERTLGQKRAHRAQSRQRVRVEHLFAFRTGSRRALFQRGLGYARHRAGLLLANLSL